MKKLYSLNSNTLSAEQLNRDCFCQTLNYSKLESNLSVNELNPDLLKINRQLFSDTTVFISSQQFEQMRCIIAAIERVLKLPTYAKQFIEQSPAIADFNSATAGVFMGYDFHLSAHGPKIIEINSNAGGAFLNNALMNTHTACQHFEGFSYPPPNQRFDQQVIAMFKNEWQLQQGEKTLNSIAIVDHQPEQQFLFSEFKMAQRLFSSHGIKAVIADAQSLSFDQNQLLHDGKKIDLVYNRLTDFYLSEPYSAVLRQAYLSGAVVVTPNPQHHAFYADKRRLTMLSNLPILREIDANATDCSLLSNSIPFTETVTLENADRLWKNRKQFFFKPAIGYGSRATYRGDKITKRVWCSILQNSYVAQQQISPSERDILIDGEIMRLKVDVRAYTYAGEIQLLAARIYQGQTTNFRTKGGGFAPVMIV